MRTNLSIFLVLGLLGACSTVPGVLEGGDEADEGSDSDSDSTSTSESDGESSDSDGETSDGDATEAESSSDTETQDACAACLDGELCVAHVDSDVCTTEFGFTISCVPTPDACGDLLCDPACVLDACGGGYECVPDCSGDPVDLWCGVNPFSNACDPLLQNCFEGEKCVPIIEVGPNNWDANICVPLLGNGQPGDPCMTFDDWSDDCGPRMHCNVEPGETGNCQLMCNADATCEAGLGCLIANEGVLPICLPTCDPEAPQPCPEGQVCYWDQLPDQWLCVPE